MNKLASGVLGLSIISLSIPARAGDTKFYPAAMCQGGVFQSYTFSVFVGSTPAIIPGFYLRPPTYQVTGAVVNAAGDQDMPIVCPLVRDVVRSDSLGWTSLFINVLNTSHTRDLTCTARTFFTDDYGFGSVSSNTLGHLTNWTDLPLSALALPSDGYMIVTCTLPRVDSGSAPSGVASYRIDE